MREDMILVECYYTGRLFYINSNHITTIKPLFKENDDTDLVGSIIDLGSEYSYRVKDTPSRIMDILPRKNKEV